MSDMPVVGKIEYEPLPNHWRVLLDGWKRDSTAYYKALQKIRDFSGADIPEKNLRPALKTINQMADSALQHGGSDEED